MLKKITIILVLSVFISCRQDTIQFPETSEIIGLATPIMLNPEETEIVLEDYFTDVSLIDSVSIPESLDGKLTEDKKYLLVRKKTEILPYLMVLKVWVKGFPYAILLKKSEKLKYTLTFDPKGHNYQNVSLAGEMNGWNPKNTHFKLTDGKWQIELLLYPGRYQYQLVLDNNWLLDPGNPDSVDNNIGGYNSLLVVGEDFNNKLPKLFTYKYEDNLVALGVKNNPDKIIVFWQNYQLSEKKTLFKDSIFSFSIPDKAKNFKRSFLRIWAENEYGASNDILIPLDKRKIVNNVKELNREDWEAAVLYFLMIDRFNNGKTDNDFRVDDPEILPKVNYYGGDIIGITQKIRDGYFEDLGINTIWLSPITQNPLGAYGLWPEPRTKFSGYHGYWPISSSKVDFRFGTDDELKELVNTAHEHNMNVILDYVANHVHELHPVYQQHPDWATDLYLPDGSLNTEKWDEYRLTTWFDTFLPTLDLSRPDVVDVMTDSAVFWIQNYDMDGFRHDATKHIPEIFWRTLTDKLKKNVVIPQNKRIYQIGETYGNKELIGSYVSSGMVDGQFDFNVYDNAVAVFARDDEPFEKLVNSLQESLDYYGYHNLMGYITGNQDKPRFISLAGGDLKFGENSKLAGWTRDIGVGDKVGYKKLQLLNAFILTIPGVPSIYYGDEIGMPGANDPDNRRMMRFNDLNTEEKQTRKITKELIHLRRNNLVLIYGDFELLYMDKKTLAFARTYFDKIVIVVFNKMSKPLPLSFDLPERFENASLKANFGSQYNLDGTNLKIIMEGNSFEVLIN